MARADATDARVGGALQRRFRGRFGFSRPQPALASQQNPYVVFFHRAAPLWFGRDLPDDAVLQSKDTVLHSGAGDREEKKCAQPAERTAAGSASAREGEAGRDAGRAEPENTRHG